jgi:hypothetical protein
MTTPANDILRLNGASPHDPAIDTWLATRPSAELASIARHWFDRMRQCGDDVVELMHDGCPVACIADVPFAYVNVFKHHVNVGFFNGAALADPARLLEGTGKRMRHVKLRLDREIPASALRALIAAAYLDGRTRAVRGQPGAGDTRP